MKFQDRGGPTLPASPEQQTVRLLSATSTHLALKMSKICMISVLAMPGGARTFINTSSLSAQPNTQLGDLLYLGIDLHAVIRLNL